MLRNILVKEYKQLQNDQTCFKILSLGCGPAIEIQQIIENHEVNCEIYLLDFNQETIEHTKHTIEKNICFKPTMHKIKYMNISVLDLIKGKVPIEIQDIHFNAIYCAGLFDYFSDIICKKLMEFMYKTVSNNGIIIATNVYVENPSKYFLEYLMEWGLLLRSKNDMLNLLPPKKGRVFFDPTGVNIFLEIRKHIE